MWDVTITHTSVGSGIAIGVVGGQIHGHGECLALGFGCPNGVGSPQAIAVLVIAVLPATLALAAHIAKLHCTK